MCLRPEFIGARPADYESPPPLWMIGKCQLDWPDGDTRNQCENPVPDSSLQSIVPVTDHETGLPYRNIFCLICNQISSTYIEKWGMKLVCDVPLQLPEKEILDKLKSHNCSIIFQEPRNSNVELCFLPP